jgi:hypothetical protein
MQYVSLLAFPRDYRAQEYLSTWAKNKTGATQIWMGLDAR